MEQIIHSSNDIPSATDPNVLAMDIAYDDIPAGVGAREQHIAENDDFYGDRPSATNGRYHGRNNGLRDDASTVSSVSRRSNKAGAFSQGRPTEWRHRVKEDPNAAAAVSNDSRFGKLRSKGGAPLSAEEQALHQPISKMKDSEKRALAASKIKGKVNSEKIAGALDIAARSYDMNTEMPPMPPSILNDTPDIWYREYRRGKKEHRLEKEQSRQAELQRQSAEKNNSFGFKVQKAFSDMGASIGRSKNSAKKGTENRALQNHEMQAHTRLVKYFPHLQHEHLVCAFDAEVVHENQPIAGHIILTDQSLCFVGKGVLRREVIDSEAMEAREAKGWDDRSSISGKSNGGKKEKSGIFDWIKEHTGAKKGSHAKKSDLSNNSFSSHRSGAYNNNTSSGNFDSVTSRNSSIGRRKDPNSEVITMIDKKSILVCHSMRLIDIISYAPGIVLKCADKHKTFIKSIPAVLAAAPQSQQGALMNSIGRRNSVSSRVSLSSVASSSSNAGGERAIIPNALQFFANDGRIYQFRHFHLSAAANLSTHDGHKDATVYDRFLNFFDHQWRSQGGDKELAMRISNNFNNSAAPSATEGNNGAVEGGLNLSNEGDFATLKPSLNNK